jgi:prenyltransferase beta subunit
MTTPSSIDYLISAQHKSGGWGYQTGHQPIVESTATVLLAIRDERSASDSFQRGLSWLLDCQHEDGGWGINENDSESGWQTAWAIMVLKQSTQSSERMHKAVDWLTSVPTYAVSKDEFSVSTFPKRDSLDALVWPWLPGQAGWLEPTALAVLALYDVSDSALAVSRIKVALEYFSHYRTPGGGWNIGNTSQLDTIIIPRAYHTALVLMAMEAVAPQNIQPVDITALKQDLLRDSGMLAHASGSLSMKMLKQGNPSGAYISSSQLPDGSWEQNPFVTAWSMFGLRGYI